MKIAYFDCFSGAGGDMIVASLVDAGADAGALCKSLDSIGLDGYALSIEPIVRQGFKATRFQVDLKTTKSTPHRHLGQVLDVIRQSPLSERVKKLASQVFCRLAEAEAKVHGTSTKEVHFHEVGAVDAILDITGAMLALELLGIDRVVCSPITTGSGVVHCEHGVLPVPAPATAELLKGVPVDGGDEVGELITPTAAAVLTTLATEYRTLPPMTLRTVGFGAGSREGGVRPNLLRVLIGDVDSNACVDEICVLETNLDDASGELIGHCMERLLEEGALDAYTVPIHMKKSRSGVILTVLCEPSRVNAMERLLFAETTTFGIRRYRTERVKMKRRHDSVSTPYGDIRIKVGERHGTETVSPEFEDCRAAAKLHDVALRTVIAAANAAWRGNSDD